MSIPDEKLARWAALPRPLCPPWFVHERNLVVNADDDPVVKTAIAQEATLIAALPEMREALDELVAEVRRLRDGLRALAEHNGLQRPTLRHPDLAAERILQGGPPPNAGGPA